MKANTITIRDLCPIITSELRITFDCSMPEDGQEVLISTPWGVSKDIVEYDDYEGIGLEDHGDFDNVLAWMPLPEPYTEEDADT